MNAILPKVSLRRLPDSLRSFLFSSLLIEAVILLVAFLLRIWFLDLKPAHFDEGINGWFVDQMRASGFYRYDPENYHGPFYFYVLFVSLSLLGRNLWALRLPVVLASMATVWMTLRFDRYFGVVASRFAALALALSPAAIFYGRYAIHESWLVLALMMLTWGIFEIWTKGSRIGLYAVSAGTSLLLLIKETAVIHLVCFLLAGGVFLLWEKAVPSRQPLRWSKQFWSIKDLMWCSALSLFALIFFFSGTFLNWSGVVDFFAAYAKWFHTGTGDGGHVKTDYQVGPFNYYWLALMARYEWPALLGVLYALRLAGPVNFAASALMRYLAIYGLGALVAYSAIPYKTPWCVISLLWPFLLLFGCFFQEAASWARFRVVATVLCSCLLAGSLLLALRLNFRHFADPKEPYVYVQTLPEISLLTEPVLAVARQDPRQYAMGGQIVLDSYYPLPWILGDFTRIGYYDKLPGELDGDFIVALASKEKEIEARIKGPYLKRRFQLRDSMEECEVWFRESRFHEWFSHAEHGQGHVERVIPKK